VRRSKCPSRCLRNACLIHLTFTSTSAHPALGFFARRVLMPGLRRAPGFGRRRDNGATGRARQSLRRPVLRRRFVWRVRLPHSSLAEPPSRYCIALYPPSRYCIPLYPPSRYCIALYPPSRYCIALYSTWPPLPFLTPALKLATGVVDLAIELKSVATALQAATEDEPRHASHKHPLERQKRSYRCDVCRVSFSGVGGRSVSHRRR
jgi:hypothetical protein